MKKNALSLCIALALSNNAIAGADVENRPKLEETTCPTEISTLTSEQRAKLPKKCQNSDDESAVWLWWTGGVAAVGAAVAAIVTHDGGGSDHNHKASGGTDPNVGPIVDPIVDPTDNISVYSNSAELNKTAGTLLLNGITYTYSTEGNHSVLTGPDGIKIYTDSDHWSVNSKNELILKGVNSEGNYWYYDASGKFVQSEIKTNVLRVDGEAAAVTVNDDASVAGSDHVGAVVLGDGSSTTINGATTVTDAGTGARVVGDNVTVNTHGDTTVSGLDSKGVVVNGDGAQINNTGKVVVSDGASGFDITGNAANLVMGGELDVFSTLPDVVTNGVSVAGDRNTVDLTGVMNVGDFSTGINVAGNNNSVNLSSPEINVIGQKATGVEVTGDSNNVTLTGNMTVDKNQKADNAAEYFYDSSTGIDVKGSANTVTLDGTLTIVVDTESTDEQFNNYSGSQENIRGLMVSGDGNTVNLGQGFDLVGQQDVIADPDAGDEIADKRTGPTGGFISVDGASTVHLGGDSTITNDMPVAFETVINLDNQATLIIDEGASVINTANMTSYDSAAGSLTLIDAGNASSVLNQGDIKLNNMTFTTVSGTGSKAVNEGSIDIQKTAKNSLTALGGGIIRGGAQFNNQGDIHVSVTQGAVFNGNSDAGLTDNLVFDNKAMSVQGITVSDEDSVAVNSEEGHITASGRGSVGMFAVEDGAIKNDGTIIQNSLWKDPSDSSTLAGNIGTGVVDYGAGMAAGTNANFAGSRSSAIALNSRKGTITVYNAGAGMVATGVSNVAINQGTINLDKDANYDPTAPLVGMAAYGGGTVINDTTGVININVDTGMAFYSDGNTNNKIINNGQVNVNGSAIDSSNPQMGAATTHQSELYNTFTHAGETNNFNDTDGYIAISEIANYGDSTFDSALDASGYRLFNMTDATLELSASGSINMNGGVLDNHGTLTGAPGAVISAGTVYNRAGAEMDVDKVTVAASNSTFFNDGTLQGTVEVSSYTDRVVNTGDWSTNNGHGAYVGRGLLYNQAGGVIHNSGEGTAWLIDTVNQDGKVYNSGDIIVDSGYGGLNLQGTSTGSVSSYSQNSETGTITGNMTGTNKVLINVNKGVGFANLGTITVKGDNAVAIQTMNTGYSSVAINAGVINVGTKEGQEDGSNGSGLIGMKGSQKMNVINNTATGVVNIYANDSYAFGGTAKFINNGTVNIDENTTGSAIFAPGSSAAVAGSDLTINTPPGAPTEEATSPDAPVDRAPLMSLKGYTVGTNADGSVGTLNASHVDLAGVEVNTGFTGGTAATQVTLQNTFVGSDIHNEGDIQSDSVVWNAQGTKDTSGNVDVTMTKNAYTTVTDASVGSVAAALDAGYTNNALYRSLNLKTSQDVTRAMSQLSGSNAVSAFNEAKVLSNRFTMLADNAVVTPSGLGFNVVAKGDKRAELGNNTQYDMLALSQKFDISAGQSLTMQYGIARLDGSGDVQRAGDNGLTGGYSQFFGLEHTLALSDNLNLDTGLRYDNQQLNSNRTIQYGDVHEIASADNTQQYMELKSQMSRSFDLGDSLKLKPSAGIKLRHTIDGAVKESGASDFNLNMSSSTETVVDAVIGMEMSYAGKNGWAVNSKVEGGPNVSYSKSGRTASLQGAAGQQFNVNDGQQGGGVNGLATVGVSYNGGNTSLGLDAYSWQEDSANDKGMNLNFKVKF